MKRILILPLLSMSLAAQERLDLSRAIAATVAAEPRLKSARALSQAAEARQEQAGWDRVGRFETTFQYTPSQKSMRLDLPGGTFEFRPTERYSLTAGFNQPVWTWGALSGQLEAARAEAEASRRTLGRTRQQLVFEATQAYAQAVLASEGLEVARQDTLQQQEFMRVAAARVKAGSAARLDELKAELALAQAGSAEGEARNRASQAREVLASLTRDPRFRSCELSPMEDTLDAPEPEPPADMGQALARRLDLEALRLQSRAMGLGADAAKAAGLPAISLRASITQQHEDRSLVFRRESQLYQVGLAITWDATGMARSRARAAELKAQQRSLQENLRWTESTVALEVRQARSSLKEARERVRVQGHAKAVAEEQARIARLAYREGTITAVEAQDAERALTQARLGALRAAADASLAKASLTLALGE